MIDYRKSIHYQETGAVMQHSYKLEFIEQTTTCQPDNRKKILDFIIMLYLSVKFRLFRLLNTKYKNVDFSNRQELKSAHEVIQGIKVKASNALS